MIEDRLAALEARVRAAEDELAIQRLVASYGPAVDCSDADAAAGVFAEDGAYDAGGGFPRVEGREALVAFYSSAQQHATIAKGVGHITMPPRLTIDGDVAEGIGYSLFLMKAEGGWNVLRASANAWRFARTAEGWRVAERKNNLLDGSDALQALFRQGIVPQTA